MIALGRNDEHRHPNILDSGRSTVDHKTTGGKFIVDIEALQIFGMHAVRHPGRVCVPRHEVCHWRSFAHHVLMDVARPHQVIAAQERERSRHLIGGEIAFVPHHASKVMQSTMINEKREFSGFGEIRFSCEQRY